MWAYGACESEQEAVQVSVVRSSRSQRPWCKRQYRCERHRESPGLECACSQQPSYRAEGATAGIGGRGRPDRDPSDCSRLSGRWLSGSVRLTHGKPRGLTPMRFTSVVLSRPFWCLLPGNGECEKDCIIQSIIHKIRIMWILLRVSPRLITPYNARVGKSNQLCYCLSTSYNSKTGVWVIEEIRR